MLFLNIMGCNPIECGDGTILQDTECVATETESLECGDGTISVDGECLPESDISCGEGTIESNGECLPESVITCGPGTIEIDGECQIEESIECGYGTVLRGDNCVDADLQFVSLPFPEGLTVEVSQGHHGSFSHQGSSTYAIDILVPEGTEIAAAKSGLVWLAYDSSNDGCGDVICADLGNYIIIDHGDGTFGKYWHLQQYGALVEAGEMVQKGQIIGLSGNTGWSTEPHLHFEVGDVFQQSLPLHVDEFTDVSYGVPHAGVSITSTNFEDSSSEAVSYSSCPDNLFQFMGISLTSDVPCSVAIPGQSYEVIGQNHTTSGMVLINQYINDEWQYNCIDTEQDGSFAANISWNQDNSSSHLMISAAEDDCYSFAGWAYSPRILVRTNE